MSSNQIQSPSSDEMTRALVAKHLQGREKEWTNLNNKTRPLHLLDLPLDLLQAIIKEITHTNDLTSLALTHSALHTIVTPHIYARFDIVWPDAAPTIESRVGVDALTYGLATLVMAHDVFGEETCPRNVERCTKCGHYNFCNHRATPSRRRKTRRGNNFARHTKKFSLGNGPEDWVKEYLITKEGGKMLGTLVALAVGRMRNLESFTWDMPTGVLRDVWLALASLDDRDDGEECRLDRVWVRWHDNQDTWLPPSLPNGPLASSTHSSHLPHLLPDQTGASFYTPPYPTVQFPTLSVLPPLRSLSVLDIDEVSYVEEMSVLLESSLSRLKELRVGLAHHAQNLAWTKPKEDRSFVPPGPMLAREQRRGGLLGILTGRFCTAFNEALPIGRIDIVKDSKLDVDELDPTRVTEPIDEKTEAQDFDENDMNQLGNLLSAQTLGDDDLTQRDYGRIAAEDEASVIFTSSALPKRSPDAFEDSDISDRKLALEILELERISLSVLVLSKAFDWSRITTLTLLGCRNHETLWKALRKQFTPPSRARASSASKQFTPLSSSFFGRRSTSVLAPTVPQADFKLRITRLHTDTVSPTLLAFIKDTLAPDSLEYLFLQQSPTYKCSVTIDQIYKYAVRRHRASLRKLLIDSYLRSPDGSPDGNTNWRKWAVSKELITCITSGRMQLRELSIGIDYKDWHFFLQRLPHAQQLRSLHITHMAGYVHGRLDPKEAALQVLDIVSLKPELELSYLGMQAKCFEIIEYQADRKALSSSSAHEYVDNGLSPQVEDDDDDDDSDEQDEPDLVNHDNDSDDLDLTTDHEDLDDSEDESIQAPCKTAFKLREILFYDDKISIFKARHGKL